ncbi:hypothetical protein EIP86_001438 [Pleurotus ostreatoroseus]|nr:hypothetical protein EIP86_001438 [Pleurotus ostreatoroseus]
MASTSRRTLSAPQRPRPRTDVFKPKFPIDPFAAAPVREPWFLRPDALSALAFHPRRDVLLVLGAPSIPDLDALLSSKLLANSLLIIATHQSLSIPHTALPTVRILKLAQPLAVEHEGAVRLAVVLEWAQRVARVWRTHGGYGAVELQDDQDGAEHLPPPSLFRFRGSHSTPPSPRASATSLAADDPRASLQSVSHLSADGPAPARPPLSPLPRPQSLSARLWSRPRVHSSAHPHDDARPLDGLINFLPPGVADKALLKQAILVTTISTAFLAAPPRYSPRNPRKPRSSLSFGALGAGFGAHSTASVNLPPTPPFQSGESVTSDMSSVAVRTRAHIVHVLPGDPRTHASPARTKLVQSIEAFLLSYAYPAGLQHDKHDSAKKLSGSNFMMDAPDARADRALPFIMSASTLNERVGPDSNSPIPAPNNSSTVPTSPYNTWPAPASLLELVLCGTLDAPSDPFSPSPDAHGYGPGYAHALPRTTPRALLTGAADVVLLAEDTPAVPAVVVSASEPAPLPLSGYSSASTSPSMSGYVSASDSSPPSSAASSPPRTPPTACVRGSPLAKSMGGGGGVPCVSLGGLPTPPDSEDSESGEEGAEGARKRTSGDSGVDVGMGSVAGRLDGGKEGGVTVGDDASAKGRRMRWRFWKRAARGSR